jgi:Na+-transporting methylmalonyl-CoA/oxaloacetate decarboxylase gamma subunit
MHATGTMHAVVELLEREFDDPRERAEVLHATLADLGVDVRGRVAELIGQGVPPRAALETALAELETSESGMGFVSAALNLAGTIFRGISDFARKKQEQREQARRERRERNVPLSSEEAMQIAARLEATGHTSWNEAARAAAAADIAKIRIRRTDFLPGEADRVARSLKQVLKQRKQERKAAEQRTLLMIGGGGAAALLLLALLVRGTR